MLYFHVRKAFGLLPFLGLGLGNTHNGTCARTKNSCSPSQNCFFLGCHSSCGWILAQNNLFHHKVDICESMQKQRGENERACIDFPVLKTECRVSCNEVIINKQNSEIKL